MGYSSRVIPGVTAMGKTRGGGSESIAWGSDGPMLMIRSVNAPTPGSPLVGPNYVYIPALSYISNNDITDNTVKSMGDSAIRMSRPASPSVNLLTSAGELASDGVPSMPDLIRWRKSLLSLRNLRKGVAKDYVAWNFSWKPLEAEIRSYYKRVIEADDIMQKAQKASRNNVIRVGHSYPIAAETQATQGALSVYRWSDGYPFGVQGSGVTWKQNYRRVWFEGKYLTFPPVPQSAQKASGDFSAYAKEVLGLELTPEVLWNLSPWSWFSDWISNTDVIMQSVSDLLSDGLVPVSSFVMCHTRRETLTMSTKLSSWTAASNFNLFETKKRFVSAPYLGFGGTGTLSTRQLSILAALGVKR